MYLILFFGLAKQLKFFQCGTIACLDQFTKHLVRHLWRVLSFSRADNVNHGRQVFPESHLPGSRFFWSSHDCIDIDHTKYLNNYLPLLSLHNKINNTTHFLYLLLTTLQLNDNVSLSPTRTGHTEQASRPGALAPYDAVRRVD